jgi:hypothetical protein
MRCPLIPLSDSKESDIEGGKKPGRLKMLNSNIVQKTEEDINNDSDQFVVFTLIRRLEKFRI